MLFSVMPVCRTIALSLLLALLWLCSGFVNGLTSFGSNLLAIPVMSLFMPPKDAIITACFGGLAVTVTIVFLYRSHLDYRELLKFFLPCLITVPLGTEILQILSPAALLLFAGCVMLLFLIWQGVASRMPSGWACPAWSVFAAGGAAGLLVAATGMGGPPFAVYAMLRRWDKETSLAMINMSGVLSLLVAIGTQWQQGLLTQAVQHAAAIAVPASVVGVLCSLPLLRRMNIALFRRLVLLMVAFATATMFVRSFSLL